MVRELARHLGEREHEDLVALPGAEFAVATGGNQQILLTIQRLRHRRGLSSGRELILPEFSSGVSGDLCECGETEKRSGCQTAW